MPRNCNKATRPYVVGLVVRIGRSTAVVERAQRGLSARDAAARAERRMKRDLAQARVEAVAL